MKASLDSLVRKTIDRAEHCSGWLHKRQRIEPSGEPVKLNLGSGLYVAPGWINIDGSIKTLFVKMPRPVLNVAFPLTQAGDGFSRDEFADLLREHRFVFHNLKYGIPLADSSVDFIFCSHMLHHLYRDEALMLLREAVRVLKPGGTMRLAVPDLERIVALYLEGKREQALEYFFYPKKPRGDLYRRAYQYDFVLLKALMEEAGVRNVRRCNFREGRVPDLERLDRMPEESLFAEGER
jgi:predicted SAM-dependent methyltransferase